MSDKTQKNDPADRNGSPAGTLGDISFPWLTKAEDYARREPTKAVAYAFGAGLLLHLVPTRATTAIVFTLARPVLLGLGLLKAWEMCPCTEESKN